MAQLLYAQNVDAVIRDLLQKYANILSVMDGLLWDISETEEDDKRSKLEAELETRYCLLVGLITVATKRCNALHDLLNKAEKTQCKTIIAILRRYAAKLLDINQLDDLAVFRTIHDEIRQQCILQAVSSTTPKPSMKSNVAKSTVGIGRGKIGPVQCDILIAIDSNDMRFDVVRENLSQVRAVPEDQIYQALNRLKSRGYVITKPAPRTGKPGRPGYLYSLTNTGKALVCEIQK